MEDTIEAPAEPKPNTKRPSGEKRKTTIRRYPDGPYVRELPRNVQKSFKELTRAVQSDEEYAFTWFACFRAPMIGAGVSPDVATTAAIVIMINLFQRDMRETRAFKKWLEREQDKRGMK